MACFVVPGCHAAWKAQYNLCFILTSKSSSNWNAMKTQCQDSGGELMRAANKSTFRLLEQFLYTIQLNSESPLSQCLVTGPVNTSSFSTLPLVKESVSNSTTHICAIRSSNQWKLQGCSVNSCDELCIAPRGEKDHRHVCLYLKKNWKSCLEAVARQLKGEKLKKT